MHTPGSSGNLSWQQLAQQHRARRNSVKYRKKRRIVRDLWLISGVLMLITPVGMNYVLALGTTFLAFAILDETP